MAVVLLGLFICFVETHSIRRVLSARRIPGAGWSSLMSRGCNKQKTCQDCLMSTPYMHNTYCRWCPGTSWAGDPGALDGKAGVCRSPTKNEDDCAGRDWAYVGKRHGFGGSPKRAQDWEDATLFCPKPTEQDKAGKKLADITAQDLENINSTSKLENIINEINMDLQRLNRFMSTNPPLFNKQFSYLDGYKRVGLYTWKLVTWGITFIPGVGGPLSFGLQKATTIAEAAYISKKGNSQDLLISKGEHANLHYFGDVTFGNLHQSYKALLRLTHEEVEEATGQVLNSALSGEAGVAAHKAKQINEHGGVVAAKAGVATGLFVGGFFTFGATWIAGAVWGGVDLAASASISEAARAALESRTKLLVAMAREMDASIWNGEGLNCSITTWFEGQNPCPPVQSAAECGDASQDDAKDGEKPCKDIPRVCSRQSPWGHHEDHIPAGSLSPEGRCMRAPEVQLQDGLPCLVHESCLSGYCHFESRLEYFFSNHRRQHCTQRDMRDRKCTPAGVQLHSLQVMSPHMPRDGNASENETLDQDSIGIRPIEEFASQYDTYDAVKYATTGTCARACPLSEVGKGDCALLTFGNIAAVQGESGKAGEYGFGISVPNRIFTGSGKEGYKLVGEGDCASEFGSRLETIVWTLDPAANPNEGVINCAREMHALGKAAFVFNSEQNICSYIVKTGRAPGLVVPPENGKSACYTQLARWPLDIHQPWNPHWTQYVRNIDRLTEWLQSEREGTLDQVRKAYHDFCPMEYKADGHCPEPGDWDSTMALHMLLEIAPLSAEQLRAICEAIEPTSTTAKESDKIPLKDLFERPLRFGDAWKRYLGSLNVNEVETEEREGMAEENRAVLQRWFVEQMEQIAVEYNFRYSDDGLWDLNAAMAKYSEGVQASMNDEE